MSSAVSLVPIMADLDLIFANPDGYAPEANSVSASVSLLFRSLGLPKGASLHSLRHSHGVAPPG